MLLAMRRSKGVANFREDTGGKLFGGGM